MIRQAAKSLARLVLAEEIADIKREYDTHESTLYAKRKWEEWREIARRREADLDAVREAWTKERAGYDETVRVWADKSAEHLRRAEKAEARLASAINLVPDNLVPDEWRADMNEILKLEGERLQHLRDKASAAETRAMDHGGSSVCTGHRGPMDCRGV